VPVAAEGEIVAVSVTLAPTVGVVVETASAVVVAVNAAPQVTPLSMNEVGIALVALFQVPLKPMPVRLPPAGMLPL